MKARMYTKPFRRGECGIPSVERDPSVGVLDGLREGFFKATYGQSARQRLLGAAQTIHIVMLVSFLLDTLRRTRSAT